MKLLESFVTRSTYKTLQDKFPKTQIDELVHTAWQRYAELAPDLLDAGTPTARLIIKLACAFLALYEALLNVGVKEDQAHEMISDIAWYTWTGGWLKIIWVLQYRLSRLISRSPKERLQWTLDLLWRYVFTIPPWDKIDLPSNDGVLALNVTRCPVAEYFGSIGHQKLCVSAFCSMDTKVTEIWNVELQRSGLLATGAPCCDFRYQTS